MARRFATTTILAIALHAIGMIVAFPSCAIAADAPSLADELASIVREMAPSPDVRARDSQMLSRGDSAALRAAGARETATWHSIQSRAQWETYRDQRIEALRRSLGPFPNVAGDLHVRITGKVKGERYQIENLIFQSRPGLFITANLYEPIEKPESMPCMLLCHSHHAPKWDDELQDMAMTWAQRGCTVLVMDLLGHGERRQHPFATDADYPGPFKVRRQDYYFRYNVGMQLQLVGQSLTGWIAWDLMRGIDLLLARPGIDPKRIILLGSVAGGGDLAAVTAALDPRVAAVAEFNFGGPQPETRYPLPEDSETRFDYVGGGSWESTRNLFLSARDGFLPWVIVGSVAPRRLIYGHEFSWDTPHDPVWARLQRIYGFYDAPSNLAGAQGRGLLSGHPPQASHANNIGPIQLQGVYPPLHEWFGIAAPANSDHRNLKSSQLTCMTPQLARELSSRLAWELASNIGQATTRTAHTQLAALAPEARRARLRELWRSVLGEVDPPKDVAIESTAVGDKSFVHIRRVTLRVESDIIVPVLMLSKADAPATQLNPLVIAIAQDGHSGFLLQRASDIARLIDAGVTVCLPDLRGTGDTRPADASRGRTSEVVDISASALMLGRPLLGQRLRDLRCVIRYMRSVKNIDDARIALWGDSFADANGPDVRIEVPFGADPFPAQSEPLGDVVVLLAALFEPGVSAVSAHGGLSAYQSIIESPFCYVPHDIVVPNVMLTGDLPELAAALVPVPLRLTALVDGRNRLLDRDALDRAYASVIACYRDASAAERLQVKPANTDGSTAVWLLDRFRR